MISRIGFAPFAQGLSIEAAQDHWAQEHARVTMTMPGIKRYWQNHAIWRDGCPLLPWPGFDACSEFDFDDVAAMDQCFASKAYSENVKPDEAELVDKTRGGYLIAHRHGTGTEASPLRLIRMYRAAPLRRVADIDAVLRSRSRGDVPLDYYLALDGAEAAQRCAAYDAVELTGFETEREALAFANSETAREQRLQLGGLIRGCDMLIARLVRIF